MFKLTNHSKRDVLLTLAVGTLHAAHTVPMSIEDPTDRSKLIPGSITVDDDFAAGIIDHPVVAALIEDRTLTIEEVEDEDDEAEAKAEAKAAKAAAAAAKAKAAK